MNEELSAPKAGNGRSQLPNPRGCRTHLAAGLVVVQVHGSPGILSCLQGIDELLGYCLSEAHVVTAASPQPALTSWKSVGRGKVVEQVVRILLGGCF